MLFTQIDFMFVFLPVALAGYFLIGALPVHPAARLGWLAAASLTFYGYWNVSFLSVIGVSIAGNYVLARLVSCQIPGSLRRKAIFILAVTLNLTALAFFKYRNFGLEIVSELLRMPLHKQPRPIVLPLGISFFTFTQLAYLADVFAGHPSERSFAKYSLFVTYFPHLIAGPIFHHREMMPQFEQSSRSISAERMAIGVTVFAIGLFKKVILADGFSLIAAPVFDAANHGHVAGLDAWGGALAYSLQIYFDFSGYCDMALGLSSMFNITLPFNFDAPYKSRSIIEFWRRWHITLSRFLRDYLYIPLGGSRHGEWRRYFNLGVTMLLGGLWHGAGWTYIAWGALHGCYLICNHGWLTLKGRIPPVRRLADTAAFGILALLVTQLCVVVAWVLFRADSMSSAGRLLAAMCELPREAGAAHVIWPDMAFVFAGYAICVGLPNVNAMFGRWAVGFDSYRLPRRPGLPALEWTPNLRWAVAVTVALMVSICTTLLSGNLSPFLYFQF